MNAVAEETDLVSIIQKASPMSRRVALESLIGSYMEDTNFLPQPIRNTTGEVVGLFVPHYCQKPTAPPILTTAEEAELVRRLRTPDNSVSAEEFIELVEEEGARLSRPQ